MDCLGRTILNFKLKLKKENYLKLILAGLFMMPALAISQSNVNLPGLSVNFGQGFGAMTRQRASLAHGTTSQNFWRRPAAIQRFRRAGRHFGLVIHVHRVHLDGRRIGGHGGDGVLRGGQ